MTKVDANYCCRSFIIYQSSFVRISKKILLWKKKSFVFCWWDVIIWIIPSIDSIIVRKLQERKKRKAHLITSLYSNTQDHVFENYETVNKTINRNKKNKKNPKENSIHSLSNTSEVCAILSSSSTHSAECITGVTRRMSWV